MIAVATITMITTTRRSERTIRPRFFRSARMAPVLEQVERVAASDATLLILGETGTGKEVIAQLVHDLSVERVLEVKNDRLLAVIGPREIGAVATGSTVVAPRKVTTFTLDLYDACAGVDHAGCGQGTGDGLFHGNDENVF